MLAVNSFECNNNPQCTYSDKPYNYCAGDSDEETAFYKCTEESCWAQSPIPKINCIYLFIYIKIIY